MIQSKTHQSASFKNAAVSIAANHILVVDCRRGES
jgi:hypothetical protein